MRHFDFPKVKTAIFRGFKYRLVWRKPRNTCPDPASWDVGQCDHPKTPQKTLWIWPNQEPWDLLETMIHEGIHGGNRDLDEECVDETARDLVRFLKRVMQEPQFK